MLKLLLSANLLMIATFILKFKTLPPQIPLYFSKLWGEGQLADLWMIFIIPIFMNILFFSNQYIFNRFYSENTFIKNIFYYLNLFLIIAFTLIFVKIIFIISWILLYFLSPLLFPTYWLFLPLFLQKKSISSLIQKLENTPPILTPGLSPGPADYQFIYQSFLHL